MNEILEKESEESAFLYCKEPLETILQKNNDATTLNKAFELSKEDYDSIVEDFKSLISVLMDEEKKSVKIMLVLKQSKSLKEFCLKYLMYNEFIMYIMRNALVEELNPLELIKKLMRSIGREE
jgi:hypothetical protein